LETLFAPPAFERSLAMAASIGRLRDAAFRLGILGPEPPRL
jgi:hypothetical protein